MNRIPMMTGAVVLAIAGAAYAQPMNPPPPMGEGMTSSFIAKAAQSDEFERREGRLAEVRSHDPHVKKFAAMMVTAHTRTTKALKAAIGQAGMTPPPPPALSDDQMQMIASLKAMHGHGFDRAYMDQQVQAHEDALSAMQAYAQTGRPGPIREAAQSTVPLVQQHLDMAKAIQGRMGG